MSKMPILLLCRILTTACLITFLATVESGCDRGEEVVVYPVLCMESIRNGQCESGWIFLNPTTYRVSVNQQRVIYWSTLAPKTLANCAVRNAWNWACEYPDKSERLWMVDGAFGETSNSSTNVSAEIELRTRYLLSSSWQRWLIRFGGSPRIS